VLNWHFLTFFGDTMLLLPTAVILFVLLFCAKKTRIAAWHWALVYGAVGAVVSISKLAFMGWGLGIARYDFTGFSGHSALSAVLWPVLLWAITGRCSDRIHRAGLLLGFLLPIAVGYSRLAIQVHSDSEVISGLFIGYLGSIAFLQLQQYRPRTQLAWPLVVIALLLPIILISQRKPAPTQGLLQHIATVLAHTKHAYTREDLHRWLQKQPVNNTP